MTESLSVLNKIDEKRVILLIEDEFINREILLAMLEDLYEVQTAETAKEAIDKLKSVGDQISLILLDLNLPDEHGLEILKYVKREANLSNIPVIVMTADREAEEESLNEGAFDFIPKPYPLPKVVRARVRRTLEFVENRDIISVTERDQLTGLFNKEFFFKYAENMDRYKREEPMDAIAVDVNHFRNINERFGKAFADSLLKNITEGLRAAIRGEGLICRRDGDLFFVYCRHRDNYQDILRTIMEKIDSRVRIRMGVYPNADKGIDVERRFDRAKMAADTIRNSFSEQIALYDSALHESEVFSELLLEEFPKALQEKHFLVYYQAKFDIRGTTPILSSAEALVRWKHPKMGLISPAVFIPLLENNGLIQQLDQYVWREAAAQMRRWKDEIGYTSPVSVNVSRIDLFEPNLVNIMRGILEEFDLTPEEYLLEITESAYTGDSAQIIKMASQLREAGFLIEMDDFGSGYSSLNMLASLPVDALKIDMQFLRNVFRNKKNEKLLDVVIDIADSMEVTTIAEGVETKDQLDMLKRMGCDIVQGYYFSKPIPAEEYEHFLVERSKIKGQTVPGRQYGRREKDRRQYAYESLHDEATGVYNRNGFDLFMRDVDLKHIAVLIVTVDKYELITARYGKEAAEQAAEKVAETLKKSFRSVDYVCRLGRNEFAVIITRIKSTMKTAIDVKIDAIRGELRKTAIGDMPISICTKITYADCDDITQYLSDESPDTRENKGI